MERLVVREVLSLLLTVTDWRNSWIANWHRCLLNWIHWVPFHCGYWLKMSHCSSPVSGRENIHSISTGTTWIEILTKELELLGERSLQTQGECLINIFPTGLLGYNFLGRNVILGGARDEDERETFQAPINWPCRVCIRGAFTVVGHRRLTSGSGQRSFSPSIHPSSAPNKSNWFAIPFHRKNNNN